MAESSSEEYFFCWSEEPDIEEFDTLDELKDHIANLVKEGILNLADSDFTIIKGKELEIDLNVKIVGEEDDDE